MGSSAGRVWVAAVCVAVFGSMAHARVEPCPGGSPRGVASRPCHDHDTTEWLRLARDIHAETNALRRDPAAYARHLEWMPPRFDGKLLDRPGRPYLRTEEGAAAVSEAIAALKAARPAGPLRWSRGLAAAAADHVADQGPIGGLEHDGTDRSDPDRRASRYGRWIQGIAENIAYGENSAREVVIQLLVDDGVPDRGHRNNMLDPHWGVGGVACGPHLLYRQMCVMDYAVNYVER